MKRYKFLGLLLLGIMMVALLWFIQPGPGNSSESFIYLNGIPYSADKENADILTREALGSKLGQILDRVGHALGKEFYQPKDWDASHLAKGTPIYRLKDYPQDYRVAAVVKGKVKVFSCKDHMPMEMAASATRIEIFEGNRVQVVEDGVSLDRSLHLLAIIDDAPRLEQSRALLSTGEFNHDLFIQQSLSSRIYFTGESKTFFLRFVLADGTAETLGFDPVDNCLGFGYYLDDAFTSLILEAIGD